MRTSLSLASLLTVVAWLLPGCGGDETEEPAAAGARGSLAFAYVDVAGPMGYRMRNRSGKEERKEFILEAMPPGIAVADFDGDGWMDMYCPNGNDVVRYDRRLKRVTLLGAASPRNALYWNRGGARFEDGAAKAGVDDASWSFGATAGDLNNDGLPDIYLCNWGANRLYLNRGDGTFEEVAGKAGAAGDPRDWSSGACFVDYDRDGDLDIYVAQYADVYDMLDSDVITSIEAVADDDVEGTVGRPRGRSCDWKGLKVYCGPLGLRPLNDLLLRNRLVEDGTLRFENVSSDAGIVLEYGENSRNESSSGPYYGFQPVAWDIDGDGWQDIFVANDSVANLCWMNRGDGTFRDDALALGLAIGADDYAPQASMGVAVGDINRDGLMDLTITEFSHDQFNLLLGHRVGPSHVVFDEKASRTGLREWTFRALGWGALLFDPDLDGDLDIFFACGHVYPEVDLPRFRSQQTSYKQYNLLILNEDASRPKLENVSTEAGPGIREVKKCTRAAVRIDYDNDGDPDIATTELNDSPCLLRCDLAAPHHFVRIRLVGDPARKVPLDPAGAVVTVVTGAVRQSQVLFLGSSFQSSEDPRLLFGLGESKRFDSLEVLWPDGTRVKLPGGEADRDLTITYPDRIG